MRRTLRWIGCITVASAGLVAGLLPTPSDSPRWQAESLRAAYRLWQSERESEALEVALGWSRGLSSEFTRAHGWTRLDFEKGDVTVEVSGLPSPGEFDVWLVDNLPGDGRSVKPEPGDRMILVGSFRTALSPSGVGVGPHAMNRSTEGSVELDRRLDAASLRDFELDQIVVCRSGREPGTSGLLFGAPSLFERLDARTRRGGGRRPMSPRDHRELPFLLSTFGPVHASEADVDFEALVNKGQSVFFGETFSGNGRTCGTCHPAANNFTLDPAFIATLDGDDPLFVAETNPALAQNFEKPALMRQLGLILENVDGFCDLSRRFVMRAVAPTVALPVQTQAPPAIIARIVDGTSNPPKDRTGWGGDGAPGSGTLREFAIGAVVQHFTQTLVRKAGSDFRLPTDAELDALEAFQRSLGRREDLNLRTLKLRGAQPARGREIFRTLIGIGGRPAGKCNACHGNAGARDSIVPGNFVINFNTGVEEIPNQPADLIDPTNPRDGGFGTAARRGAFGNGTFSTPPVVESADTAPFFHNNAVATLEDAVRFYSTAAFNNSPAGRLVGGIHLKEDESVAVAAFLRVINALENIRQAAAYQRGQQKVGADPAEDLRLAAEELEDGGQVLSAVGLHPDAVAFLSAAQSATEAAADETDLDARAALVAKALGLEEQARLVLVER